MRIVSCVVLTVLLLLLVCQGASSVMAAPPRPEGKEYSDSRSGFRLHLPSGWEKKKDPAALAQFVSPDRRLLVMVLREQVPLSVEEYLIAMEQVWARSAPSYRKISEEEAAISGLPARKFVYTSTADQLLLRAWQIIILSRGEYWRLAALGPDEALRLSGSPAYEVLQGIISSFQFSEPVLARLKPGAAPTSPANRTPSAPEGHLAFYINDRLGIRILLPPEWEQVSETTDPAGGTRTVLLGKKSALAQVMLSREVMEASPELYSNLQEKNLANHGSERVGKEKVSRAGVDGTRLILLGKDGNIRYRQWLETFSVGREHFMIAAVAPEEVFDRSEERRVGKECRL